MFLIFSTLPLCCSVAFTFDSDHVDPQQPIERFKGHPGHFMVFVLKEEHFAVISSYVPVMHLINYDHQICALFKLLYNFY